MGVFKRLFKVGEAEAHNVVDKLEDPIKMTEQGIRDLKKDLDKSLQALAEVKAVAIRTKKEMNEHESRAKSYESKAVMLLKKAQNGDISAEEADRLAGEALNKKTESLQAAATSKANYQQLENQISQLNNNVSKLKNNISKYENELKMLKARARVSQATKKLNKSMANVDSGGTISMLEKMKDKVAQEEAMAEAYGDMADANKSFDDEINQVLNQPSEATSNAELDALKAKLNQNK
jgi:phage shock protein A